MAYIKHPKNYAWFTPSVSQMYVIAHSRKWSRAPIDFDRLNFMDEANKDLFHWPANLYSAGHAFLDPQKSDDREKMIQGRNRANSVLVGDSGGFQAATGVLDFDWKNPMSPKSMEQRMALLEWLEHTADYSMVLDWPAWAIPTGRLPDTLLHFDPTTDPLQPGTTPFDNCLKGTVWNNNFFIQKRTPGKTKFLNVLQGQTIEDSNTWYDAVHEFSNVAKHGDRAFEGWALGGATGGDPRITTRLLVRLRRDGHLSGSDRWIHVLGRSRLTTAVYLASMNRALNKHLSAGIQISYDASSAFLYAVNGNYVTDFICNPKEMWLKSTDIPMNSKYVDGVVTVEADGTSVRHGDKKMIYAGVTPERLASPDHYKSKIGDLIHMKDLILPPVEGKTKKDYCMDTASYYYIMAHNVEMQANAVEQVCDYLFSPNASSLVPPQFIEYDDFINRVFDIDGKVWEDLSESEKDFYTDRAMAIVDAEVSKFSNLIHGESLGTSTFDDITSTVRPSIEELHEKLDARGARKKPVPKAKPPKVDTDFLFATK